MKVSPAIRVALTVVGALIVIAAFLGTLYIGALNNPPPLRIIIAQRDLQRGDRLSMSDIAVENQVINPALGKLYVQEQELGSYTGAYVIDNIRRGDPLNKVRLSTDNQQSRSGAMSRYGLLLTDTNQVVMVLPVSADLIPSKIKSGDYVNILFAVGSEGGLNQLPKTTPDSVAIDQPISANDPRVLGTPMPSISNIQAPKLPIDLPLADVLLEHIEVLDVNYQQIQNPGYGSADAPNAAAFINGPITSIVMRVPRSYQTILAFAAANGKVRYAISSPMLDAASIQPSAGVDWGQIVELYRWKSEQSLLRGETLTQTLYPSYAPPTPSVAVNAEVK